MINCPWCHEDVVVKNGICPECKNDVPQNNELTNDEPFDSNNVSSHKIKREDIEDMISNKFKCVKCKHEECSMKEVAMSGTGLSKLFDIEHNHYLFVSCLNCAYVEIFDPSILQGKKAGQAGTILDIFFGG